jgi:hypothetical protein
METKAKDIERNRVKLKKYPSHYKIFVNGDNIAEFRAKNRGLSVESGSSL